MSGRRGARAARTGRRHLRNGELVIHEVTVPKEALDVAPAEHRALFLVMGQIANEVAILNALMIQSLNSQRGGRAQKEAALGTTYFLARILSGRVYEAWNIIKGRQGQFLDALIEGVDLEPGDAEAITSARAGRDLLNKYFGKTGSLLAKVRNKLAFHLDQDTLSAGYDLMTDELWPMVDFHSGHRGTTFFGGCDTVAVLAVSHLLGSRDIRVGGEALMNEALSAASAVVDFTEGFMVAFLNRYLGKSYTIDRETRLSNVPDMDRATLNFFLAASPRVRRKIAEA